jgi:hypothetical protein
MKQGPGIIQDIKENPRPMGIDLELKCITNVNILYNQAPGITRWSFFIF